MLEGLALSGAHSALASVHANAERRRYRRGARRRQHGGGYERRFIAPKKNRAGDLVRTFASKSAEESFFLRRSLQEQRDSVSKSAEFRKEKENDHHADPSRWL